MVNRTPSNGIDFQGRDPLETFQFYFRQHWVRMLGPAVRALLFTAAVFLAGFALLADGDGNRGGRLVMGSALLSALLIVQLRFLMQFYRYFLHVTVVTDRRVHRIKKTLLTHDEHESVDLWVLQDIRKVQRGPVQNMLGFGSIYLEAPDATLRLHFVPRISQRYGDIASLLEQARQRGMPVLSPRRPPQTAAAPGENRQ